MRKRTIAILVAAGLLALGLTVGVVMAQDGGSGGSGTSASASTTTTFADRVAALLGLESGVVREAFTTARRDQEDEAYKSRLDRMVEAGRLTQEEADARYTWFEGRPDSMIREYGEGKRGRHSFNRGRFRSNGGGWHGWFGGAKGQITPVDPTTNPSGGSS